MEKEEGWALDLGSARGGCSSSPGFSKAGLQGSQSLIFGPDFLGESSHEIL